jgi:cytochrome c biogenesis protein CcdA/thiol-disulfide isomerase/thioredoxin
MKQRARNLCLLVLLTIGALWTVRAVRAAPLAQDEAPVRIYFFWGDGCPACAQAKPIVQALADRYPQVELESFEVYYVEENQVLFREIAAAHGIEPRYVPTIFIGDQHWEGFAGPTRGEIEAAVEACVERGCPDLGAAIVASPGQDETTAEPTPAPTSTEDPDAVTGAVEDETATEPAPAPTATAVAAVDAPAAVEETPAEVGLLTLPLLGTIDLGRQSLWVSTAIISFVDGFNPCSLWVLSILISLTLRTGSRKKVFLTGFVFLLVTSLIYVLFIAGLFTMFTFIGFLGWIQVVVAVLALFFAGANIKDYFWYKKGISFTIADEKKPGIYKRMRKVLYADSLWAMLTATVVMSAGIALVELPCTAGFPVLWTNLLTAQGVNQSAFVLLLGLYMLIYLIDELVVFVIAVFTLKSNKLEEKHGRVLKLIGGMLMLMLATVMLIDPTLMNELGTSLLIFAGALVGALLVLAIHRHVLPQLGVYIGTELTPSND